MSSLSLIRTRTELLLLGAGALLASGGVHLDLYITGYHTIPTVGPLFLVQTVFALGVGIVVVVRPHPFISGTGALLALGTLAGYVASRAIGLFGFHEVATTAGLVAGLLETVAFCSLGYFTTSSYSAGSLPARSSNGMPRRQITARANDLLSRRSATVSVAVVGLAALVLALVSGVGGGSTTTTPATTVLASGTSVTITIKNFAFAPAEITVRPNEQIRVHNEDPVTHTLTAIPGSTPYGKFNTGDIAPGQTKSLTAPTKPGTYQYFCSIHNFMTGAITVKR